ncbi:hypothetical protein KIL84_021671 [Mauremys mutica]|uniref:Ig-like domain-containing protein n=1 Tax=Mauremys mutica TaxID=74926 RepID=A0A9D4AT50_9SAUR|nr:hypothetical protein KIL84_021671 [Mauremys mutica]
MSYGCRNAHTDSEPWPVTSPWPDPAMMTGKVPSFSPGSTVSSALPGYVALCLALQVRRLVSAHFTVTGPDRPITASVGGEAVLPCHLSPKMSAQSMEVRWFRSQHSAVVHLYQDGQDRYENQMLDYQGRTELLKDDITNGSVSLRIRDIRPSDEGQYACLFQSLTFFQDASMLLQVEAATPLDDTTCCRQATLSRGVPAEIRERRLLMTSLVNGKQQHREASPPKFGSNAYR